MFFNDGSGDEGEDGDEEADTHALERGDAAAVASEVAEEGDGEGLVEGDEEERDEGPEDGDGAWGNGEGREGAVHEGGLGDEEGGHLGEGEGEGDCCGPDWEDSDEAFELFDLCHRAQPPSAGLCCGGGVGVCYDCCLVQESESSEEIWLKVFFFKFNSSRLLPKISRSWLWTNPTMGYVHQ